MDELGIEPGAASEDDPEVIARMGRLKVLRAAESSIPEIPGKVDR